MTIDEQMRKGTTTVILLSLLAKLGRPMYGYEIIKELEKRSQGYFRFKEGLIYPRLHEMERQGLIKGEWQREEGARERKFYRITDKGQRRLAQELIGWQAFTTEVDRLLNLEGSGA
jgi:PadR family transcriptional regulator PadR